MKEKNELNIHDMSGNVWEWCEDVWHDNYDGAPQDGSAWGGYQGIRVDRGGSWFVSPLNCRAAVRDGNLPTFRYDNLGFRLVRHL
jgi:formylglycine-generating enzyme required for sulfatase activity